MPTAACRAQLRVEPLATARGGVIPMKRLLLAALCLLTLALGSSTLVTANAGETSIQLADGNTNRPGGG
jgi:hypothetical protein